jgi:6-phosphogluconolactonase (cycloisomerase 2 family)
MRDGSFLLCHLGADDGGVYRLGRDGSLEPLLLEVDGAALPPTNFAHEDKQGRLWITVSTRTRPRALAYRNDVSDGFIVLLDRGAARIVATDVGYTNECLVHPDGARLFVNETFSQRLSTYDIAEDGSLSNKKTITEFTGATFPDGMAFDQEGGIWVTSIVSNRLIRVTEDGKQQVIVEDSNAEYLAQVEAAFIDKTLGRPHLDNIQSEKLRSVSSLAFSGPDLKTVVLGCLLGQELFSFRSPVAGVAPTHWNY